MKKNSILIGIVIIILLSGCNQKDSSVNNIDTIEFIRNLSANKYIYPYTYSSKEEFSINEVLQEMDSLYTGMIYVTDGSCSICIENLLDFMHKKKEYHYSSPLIIIVNKKYVNTIAYYIEEILKDKNYDIKTLHNEQSNNFIEELNGLCFDINNGMIRGSYLYIGSDNE